LEDIFSMGILDSVKQAFARPAATSTPSGRSAQPEPAEIKVPEIAATELMAELRGKSGNGSLLLDCREGYERQQGYIPGSTHIIMREIPYRLGELDRDADIVVYCAHGNRSYGVAGYLIENGFRARSLRGGIVDWQARGGAIARDSRPRAA
jgi:rhodanese-related sulfurtransferase